MMAQSQTQRLQKEVSLELAGRRLDQILAELFPDFSRSRLQQWVKEEKVRVDGQLRRVRDRLHGGECIEVVAEVAAQEHDAPQAISIDAVYADESIVVINKPAGLVIHPAAGNRDGTLLNALLYHFPETASLPRAGIVHRLDKETSGLLVVARTLQAQTSLIRQLQARNVVRVYEAVVNGVMTGGGAVSDPIGRHSVDRKRMAVSPTGRPALTHYRVVTRFRAHTHVRLQLESGRTHQIRVHMAHIHYPLVGDPLYGGGCALPPACSAEMRALLRGFGRQALHSLHLELDHPVSGERMCWDAPLPADMEHLLMALGRDRDSHAV